VANSRVPHWAEHPDLAFYYSRQRCQPNDLYLSEKRFLPWLAAKSASVLDTGCAAGGFKNIWRHYNQHIEYSGVDISFTLLKSARANHLDCVFLQGDVKVGLPLRDRSASVVAALGWLHWEPDYDHAIEELWRITDRHLFFDVRLSNNDAGNSIGNQKLALASPWDGQTIVPYITVAWNSFVPLMLDLRPAAILGYGYWGKPAETTIGVDDQVCFAAFVIERTLPGVPSNAPTVCVDLPLLFPLHLGDQVVLVPPDQLDSLVPWSQEQLSGA